MNRMKAIEVEDEIVSKSHRYHVEGIVGEGAYGIVLKCSCKKTGEIVAIKKFKDTEDDETVRKTILREVKILRMLKHENIVTLRDAFRRKKRLYLVFEFLQRNLLQVLEEKPLGLEPELIRIYIFQLIRSIRYCHQHEIVHRDIKPENLLVNFPPDPMLKLCDFGFARTVQSRSSQLTDYVATRWYRAPELLLGLGNYGKAVDIWAIGCIMGELIDAQPLFPGESDIDQLFVIRKVLGPLTAHQREMFLHNPRFLGMKLPEIGRPEAISRRYHGKITKSQLHLMKGLLEMDERQRFTIEHAYESPYFDSLRGQTSHTIIYPSSSPTAKAAKINIKNSTNKTNTNSMIITNSNIMNKESNNNTSNLKSSNKLNSYLKNNKHSQMMAGLFVTPDFMAEGKNPHYNQNASITPPLMNRDSNAAAFAIQPIQKMQITSNKENNMMKDISPPKINKLKKRRDLRSRGTTDKADRVLRSRHIKHRKKKHHRHRHKNTAMNNNKIIENAGEHETISTHTPRPRIENITGVQLLNATSFASIENKYGLNINHSNYQTYKNKNNATLNPNSSQLPNVHSHNMSTVVNKHLLSHNLQHNSRTISRRSNNRSIMNNRGNNLPMKQPAWNRGSHIIRETQTQGGEKPTSMLNSSRHHYSHMNIVKKNMKMNANQLPHLMQTKENSMINAFSNNKSIGSDLYSGRNHHLRSRKSDRNRNRSFISTDESPRVYAGGFVKQRSVHAVGFSFSRYKHSRKMKHR